MLPRLALRVGDRPEHPEVHRVIGHSLEVERLRELHVEAGRVAKRFALRVAVGRIWIGASPEDIGVERKLGVNV